MKRPITDAEEKLLDLVLEIGPLQEVLIAAQEVLEERKRAKPPRGYHFPAKSYERYEGNQG